MKYKIQIAYEGTAYNGWQVQPNGDTIQERIQKALVTYTRDKRISVVGAGRTDAGVHARQQVAHFSCENGSLDENRFLSSMLALLPQDIRIYSLEKVSEDFHAQKSAKEKVYRYYLYLNRVDDPFARRFHWHIPFPLDVIKMQKAASFFVGKKDFSAFANEAGAGAVAKNPIRTIFSAGFFEDGANLIFEIRGDGFFYKMVRNIVGTLYDIGRRKLDANCIEALLETKDRRKAGFSAPPHGLFLHSISY